MLKSITTYGKTVDEATTANDTETETYLRETGNSIVSFTEHVIEVASAEIGPAKRWVCTRTLHVEEPTVTSVAMWKGKPVSQLDDEERAELYSVNVPNPGHADQHSAWKEVDGTEVKKEDWNASAMNAEDYYRK